MLSNQLGYYPQHVAMMSASFTVVMVSSSILQRRLQRSSTAPHFAGILHMHMRCLSFFPHGEHISHSVIVVFLFSLFYFRLELSDGLEIATSYHAFLMVLLFLLLLQCLCNILLCRSVHCLQMHCL